ncbi:MAG: OpgC domain-containing protein [Pseudomonadota bacterium]
MNRVDTKGTTERTESRSAAPKVRDPRLDFFRGIAMFIILVAHTPGNAWTGWIPARFGFSDATEIFVFCSGMASAIAFGGAFLKSGFGMGVARTVFRVWQVYWAHIGLFFFIAANMALLDMLVGGEEFGSYIGRLNLWPFFDDPMPQIVGIFTLTYVPNYFDVLPMYLVILALMPLMMGLAKVTPWLALGASVAIWLAANFNILDLPAEPWSDRTWFFNPFGWQLIFFTGFAFMMGWLPPPPRSVGLIWAAVAFIVLTSPFSSPRVVDFMKFAWPALADFSMWVYPQPWFAEIRNKPEFGLLRYIHFLSLAYLAWIAVGEGGRRLIVTAPGVLPAVWRFIMTVVTKVGQQSLAIFVFSMAMARMSGFVMDLIGRTAWTTALVNLTGFAILIGVAYTVAWFKGSPWRKRA